MRRVAVALVLLCATLAPAAASAEGHRCSGRAQWGGVRVGCERRSQRSGDGQGGSTGRAVLEVVFAAPGYGPDGRTCYSLEWRWYPTTEQAAEAERRARRRLALVENSSARYLRCDVPEDSEPPLTPEMLVAEYWRTVRLPAPAPRIAPGWALPGKSAYLELGAPTSVELSEAAPPFGRLVLEVASTYTVDWGDGTVTGPHTSPGGPWPDGDVRHVYAVAGTFDVVVTQRWSARWRLGGRSGTVGGVTTTGRLDDFEVRAVQALRDR